MIIRKATWSDVPAVMECVTASLNATYGGLWTSDPLIVGDDEWANGWVAQAGGVIGVGLAVRDMVSDLWVHPDAQGRGAGTALLAALEKEIAGKGFSMARLRCLEPNVRARAFYTSRGWNEARIYRHESIPLNTVDFEKPLAGA